MERLHGEKSLNAWAYTTSLSPPHTPPPPPPLWDYLSPSSLARAPGGLKSPPSRSRSLAHSLRFYLSRSLNRVVWISRTFVITDKVLLRAGEMFSRFSGRCNKMEYTRKIFLSKHQTFGTMIFWKHSKEVNKKHAAQIGSLPGGAWANSTLWIRGQQSEPPRFWWHVER